MKKGKYIPKRLSNVLCQFLILLAPFALANTASLLLWGEPECPDELKNLIEPK